MGGAGGKMFLVWITDTGTTRRTNCAVTHQPESCAAVRRSADRIRATAHAKLRGCAGGKGNNVQVKISASAPRDRRIVQTEGGRAGGKARAAVGGEGETTAARDDHSVGVSAGGDFQFTGPTLDETRR